LKIKVGVLIPEEEVPSIESAGAVFPLSFCREIASLSAAICARLLPLDPHYRVTPKVVSVFVIAGDEALLALITDRGTMRLHAIMSNTMMVLINRYFMLIHTEIFYVNSMYRGFWARIIVTSSPAPP